MLGITQFSCFRKNILGSEPRGSRNLYNYRTDWYFSKPSISKEKTSKPMNINNK